MLTILEKWSLSVGPVAAFTSWSFPINQIVRKLFAALAAGYSIVVKVPEETLASPAALIQCFIDARIPFGAIALGFGIAKEISGLLLRRHFDYLYRLKRFFRMICIK